MANIYKVLIPRNDPKKKTMLTVPSPQPCPPPLFSSSLSSSSTSNSKFLIIILIIAFAVLASISVNLLRHLVSRRRSSSPPPPPPPPPFCRPSSATSPPPPPPPPSDQNLLFSSSPISAPHKSPDCAVCLSPFRPTDNLRLLSSCRHAFHLQCIDLWLQSTPSCPLCRSPADPADDSGASSSCQVEIDVERVSDDEADRMRRRDQAKENDGEEEGHGWLREYLDRMVSSASTSFNSLAFSGRMSSHRFDSGSLEPVVAGDGRSWEMEGVEWAEESGLAGIYRWFVGI